MTKVSLAVLALPALLAVLALPACEDPAKDAPKATVSSAAALKPGGQTPPAALGAALALDPATSSVSFVGSKVTGKHEGKFEKVSGSVSLAGDKIEGGKIAVEVEVASVKTDQDGLDKHLKSADFFDAEKFPKATFTSSFITASDKPGAVTVTGELDLHGEKKTVTFPATITVAADSVNGTAEFSINRKDFKIIYPGKPDDLIRDDVVLKLTLKAPRKP